MTSNSLNIWGENTLSILMQTLEIQQLIQLNGCFELKNDWLIQYIKYKKYSQKMNVQYLALTHLEMFERRW